MFLLPTSLLALISLPLLSTAAFPSSSTFTLERRAVRPCVPSISNSTVLYLFESGSSASLPPPLLYCWKLTEFNSQVIWRGSTFRQLGGRRRRREELFTLCVFPFLAHLVARDVLTDFPLQSETDDPENGGFYLLDSGNGTFALSFVVFLSFSLLAS